MRIISEVIKTANIACPRCGSNKIQIKREKSGEISQKNRGVYVEKKHGVFYWLFIGWWIWIYQIMLDILTFGYTYRKRKQRRMILVDTYDKNTDEWITIAICQDCGNTWRTA